MPQELRNPQYITATPNYQATQLVQIRQILDSYTVQSRGNAGVFLAQMAIESIVPGRTIDEGMLIFNGVALLDEIYAKYEQIPKEAEKNKA